MNTRLFFCSAAGACLASAASAQLTIDATQPGSFVDISATGTPLSLSDDGEVDIMTTVGNALLPAGTVRVGSNGGVRFRGTQLSISAGNSQLPSMTAFGGEQTLMPFWDDIDTDSGIDGEIYWEEVAGTLIIQWQDVKFFLNTTDTATFQLQVPSTGPSWAQFLYEDIQQPRPGGGESATIGYQGDGWGNDIEYSYNTFGAVSDGDVLTLGGTFTPPPPPPPPPVIVDTLPGVWMDIAGTGTPLSLSDDGEVDITTTIGNGLLPAGTVRVGSNGGARFMGDGQSLGVVNQALPSTAAFSGDQTLLPFWDDIDTNSGLEGEIYWEEIGTTLVIQWDDVAFFPGGGDRATFQIQVHATGPVQAQFLYQDIMQARPGGGESATIGYQYDTIGTTWSFDTLGAVMDNTVLSVSGSGSGSIGTGYCVANANSTGSAATIFASGSNSAANNDVTLTASSLPLNQFGIFITSVAQGFIPMPGGSVGNLCLSGNIGRYNGAGQILNSGTMGSFSLALDLAATPQPSGPVMVFPGETWNYQAWYRDFVGGSAISNFTPGVTVSYQ